MDWYYASNGQQNGPVSQEQLIQLQQSGQVLATDLVWNETMSDWVAFQNVPELASASSAIEESAPPLTPAPSPASAPTASASASTYSAPSATSMPAAAPSEPIPTYLWQSIVCLVLCCLPLAIPALVFATKVQPLVDSGNYAEAREASKNAKMWCWIAFICGLLGGLAYGGLIIVGAMA